MSFKISDLTKNSKWKLTKEVPFYPVVGFSFGSCDYGNTVSNSPIGTEFTVPMKRQSIDISDRVWNRAKKEYEFTWEKKGVCFEIVVNGAKGIVFFDDIKDSIEVLEQPKDIAYVIKDTATDTYFKETIFMGWRYYNEDEPQKIELDNDYIAKLKSSESVQNVDGVNLLFSNTPLSGKVLKTLAQAKQKLMVICGYYNNSNADMLHCHAPLSSIPKTWVLVAYDRTSKTEEVLDVNCTEFIKHAFELQKLTTNYGSAVRDLYSKLEKKGELEKYKHFLIFTPGDLKQKALSEYLHTDNPLIEDCSEEMAYYGDQDLPGRYQIKKEEVKTVKELVHKDMKKSFKYDSICVAIEDKIEATELTFTYYGNLSSTLIDMSTLTEIVVPKK
ncbi:hypothetical protein XaC1_164 [Xanthomonas phage XaC1]|nr:hypothetical protein XaC1_164 [Xanthomonas phage XaC1]